jgi:hypothetical protein
MEQTDFRVEVKRVGVVVKQFMDFRGYHFSAIVAVKSFDSVEMIYDIRLVWLLRYMVVILDGEIHLYRIYVCIMLTYVLVIYDAVIYIVFSGEWVCVV